MPTIWGPAFNLFFDDKWLILFLLLVYKHARIVYFSLPLKLVT